MRVIFVLLLMAAACGKTEAPPASETSAPSEPARPALVTAYDALRARLADDDLPGAKTAAEALAKAASGDGEAAIGKEASALVAAADIEAARLAFGELSKAYLTLLAARPELAKGLQAFRCPMAAGYKKWVQVDSAMMNPYMGKRMLECGSKVELAP